ncbi:MAG: hypothetical protein HPY59_06505 [Anaerolineae bacterium]|nr:hypothetical protein [Anaerolineae bacterium]
MGHSLQYFGSSLVSGVAVGAIAGIGTTVAINVGARVVGARVGTDSVSLSGTGVKFTCVCVSERKVEDTIASKVACLSESLATTVEEHAAKTKNPTATERIL